MGTERSLRNGYFETLTVSFWADKICFINKDIKFRSGWGQVSRVLFDSRIEYKCRHFRFSLASFFFLFFFPRTLSPHLVLRSVEIRSGINFYKYRLSTRKKFVNRDFSRRSRISYSNFGDTKWRKFIEINFEILFFCAINSGVLYLKNRFVTSSGFVKSFSVLLSESYRLRTFGDNW